MSDDLDFGVIREEKEEPPKPRPMASPTVFDSRLPPIKKMPKNTINEAKIRLDAVIRRIQCLKMNGKVSLLQELRDISNLL